jgi:hypothetical protein
MNKERNFTPQVRTKILQLNGQTPPIQYVVINGTCTEDTPQLVHIVCVPGTSPLPAIFSWQLQSVFVCFVLLFWQATAKLLGNIKLGNEKQSITAQMYLSHEVWDDKTNDKLDATIHVLMDDCTPIFYGMEGKDPKGSDRIMTFLIGGFQDHVTDPSVFDKPKECA